VLGAGLQLLNPLPGGVRGGFLKVMVKVKAEGRRQKAEGRRLN